MDLQGKTIWQQAAGDTDRNYVGTCVEFDVILNGPGDAGAWPTCRSELESEGVSAKKLTDLNRFAEEMKERDVVILRMGTSEVHAVGEVVGKYVWSEAFGDVDGWNLQHVRRVRWLWQALDKPRKFESHSMKFGDTTQRLSDGEVQKWLEKLAIDEPAYRRSLTELPMDNQRDVSFEEIAEYLYDQGVASQSIETLLEQIGELVRIASWYDRTDEKPSERETVSYLAVPLLRALGWTPQKMAVEWNYVDVALFKILPRNDSNLSVGIEAKRKGRSCLTATDQVLRYLADRPSCKRAIVTDGIRYGVYLKREKGFSLRAYLNLTRLRDSYPIYKCGGAKQALLAMTPEWPGT